MQAWWVLLALFYVGSAFPREVDINSATLAELESVRGIGPAKARAIIDYRTQNGPFKNIHELERVRGFDNKTVRNLTSDIKVSSLKSKTGARASLKDLRAASRGPIDINTASQAELESLPGIGPVKARAIIDYRNQHGPFRSVKQLDNVKGFGPRSLEKFGDDITVGRRP